MKIVAALREQDEDERAAWLGLGAVARRDGWNVDDSRVPVELTYGPTRIEVGSPVPFDMSAVAFYLAEDGT
jgi:hypothetical protein